MINMKYAFYHIVKKKFISFTGVSRIEYVDTIEEAYQCSNQDYMLKFKSQHQGSSWWSLEEVK